MATHPDLASVAATLQEASQALLAIASAEQPEESTPPEASKPLPPKRPASKSGGETRSFYFPPGAVELEKDLLRKYHADDFTGLLEEAHALLVGLVKLMQSVHKDVRVKGYVISSLGGQVDHASALLLRMRNVYDKVIPVHK